MPFLQLTLTIGAADPEPFENALLAAGAISITLQDAGDAPVLEPLPGTTPLWPTVRINALFDADKDPQALQNALQDELQTKFRGVSFERVADRAWEHEWLKDFRPMRFGQRLWICPNGERPRSELLASPAAPCYVDLDPGLAFGTGTHATTALCLEWLDGADLTDQRVIDYGCGSGVLAISALKLGARAAVAIDIDPQALTAARENALRNCVADRLIAQGADDPAPTPARILLANILAEPLAALAPALSRLVTEGGTIVLSGILATQSEHLASRYEAWFEFSPATVLDGWARLAGTRRTAPAS
jgi:ribosomal protein L11 methyltransferase